MALPGATVIIPGQARSNTSYVVQLTYYQLCGQMFHLTCNFFTRKISIPDLVISPSKINNRYA